MKKGSLQVVPDTNGETCTSCVPEVPAKSSKRPGKKARIEIARFADMLSAMGTEPRLRIMQLLLKAHPEGMVVGDIQSELEIAGSTLSHHLDKLRHEGLVAVRRDKRFLWYTADTAALEALLAFLFAECCSRNKAIESEAILQFCK